MEKGAAAMVTRCGFLLPRHLIDAIDTRVINVRSPGKCRATRTLIVRAALERLMRLDDVQFARVLRATERDDA